MSSTPILLVDSFAQIYRCYHAVRHLSTADGVPTNAVFAMTKFLLKLEKEHLEFVMDCLKNNTSQVRNMKQYLLAVLFNASTTMNNRYTAQVNHDMNAGG